MSVETSSGRVRTSETSNTNNPPSQPNGLLPGERLVSELKSKDDGNFKLTTSRVIYQGSSDSTSVYASTQLRDVTSVLISQRPRARRSAVWGIVGLFAAIGVWQVTPDSTIGVAAAAAVALISLVLMADYWVRPAGVHLELQTTGGNTIGGEVGGKTSDAMRFTTEVEDAKRRLVPSRLNTPYRNYPSG
jgi:hypothetical protein